MTRHERERLEAQEARRARLHLEPIATNRKSTRDGVKWYGAEVRIRNTGPAPARDFRVWLGDEDADESYSKIAEWEGVLTRDDLEGRLFSVEIQEMYLRPNLRWVVEWTDDEGDRLLVSEKGPVGEAFVQE